MELKIERNKYSPAELALLGMFAFGLLLSFWLVSSRKKIPFSPPIIASFDGLKISMPSGRGWLAYDEWKFSDRENAFVLESILLENTRGIAKVSWQYYLAPEEKTLEQIVNQKVREGRFAKVREDKIERSGLDFTVLIFTSQRKNPPADTEDYYYAFSRLPGGRKLVLEVRAPAEPEIADRAFRAAIKGLDYSADPRLTAGKAFVEKFKAAGVETLIKKETSSDLKRVYLSERIGRSGSGKRNIGAGDYSGFSVELFSPVKDKNGLAGIKSSALAFNDAEDGWIESSLFNCDASLESFSWKTKRSLGRVISRGLELEYKDGVLRRYQIYGFGGDSKSEKVFIPSPISLPDIFADSAAALFFDSSDTNVLVDLINSTGRIIPAEISRIDPTEKLSTMHVDAVVRFTFYDAVDYFYEVLFDKEGDIIGKSGKTSRAFKMKRTDVNQVIKNFISWKYDIETMLANM